MESSAQYGDAAAESQPVARIRTFVDWLGTGRKLTQAGRITLADARALVELLDTGDVIDPKIGDRVFRTKSSEELSGLNLVVEWAKAARLVRVTKGRLVPVKKNVSLLRDPLTLWTTLFTAFPRLGGAFLPRGFAESLMRYEFADGIGSVLTALHGRDDAVPIAWMCNLAWETVTAPYVLDGTQQQLTHWRATNDRDTKSALDALHRLGAVAVEGDSVGVTELGRYGMGRLFGDPEPGDRLYQVRITLLDVADPSVWRRVLVPDTIRLDRFHEVIQAAMGWQNYHMHVFTVGDTAYGRPDPELEFHDERGATLSDLAAEGDRIGYNYDFGDDWDHEIHVEQVVIAEEDVRYPRCSAGGGACPPEDCGGPSGYEELRKILADPAHEEHEEMLTWLGRNTAADFDPAHFDPGQATQRIWAGGPSSHFCR